MSKKEEEYYKDLSKEHLTRIGERLRTIRDEVQIGSIQLTEKLNLPGAVITRFENGKGVNILNFLTILRWAKDEGYNLKWFISYNNDSEFKRGEDTIAMYADGLLDINNTGKQKFIEKANSAIKDAEKHLKSIKTLKDLAQNI